MAAGVVKVSEGFEILNGHKGIFAGRFSIWVDFGEGDGHDVSDEMPITITYDKDLKTLSFRHGWEDDQYVPFSKIVEFRDLLISKGFEVI